MIHHADRISRRRFTGGLAALVAAAAAGPLPLTRSARAQFADELTLTELSSGVHAITGRGGNALVVQGDGGAILIDTKVMGAGEDLRNLAEEAGSPIVAVINTHHHADHTGGNAAFTSDLPVYAHPSATPRVRSQVASQGENPQPFLPTKNAMEHQTLEVAGVKMQLAHPGNAHTDNDVWIRFPEKNLIHTGDLVFHQVHPFIDADAGATTTGWMDACQEILQACSNDTTVVPGHGEITGRSGVERQIEYFKAARRAVGEVVRADGPKAAVARIRLPIFEGMGFERLRTRTLETIYDEMMSERRAN